MQRGLRKQNAGGSKTLAVYGGILFYAMIQGVYLSVTMPGKPYSRFVGKKSGEKTDLLDALAKQYPCFETLRKLPKYKQSHCTDAGAHAILAIESYLEQRV